MDGLVVLIVVALLLILLDVAAMTLGADSREQLSDDHARFVEHRS